MLSSRTNTARLAGLIYLILILSGIFSILYVPSQLINGENPAQTVENIQNNLSLFQLGILSGILCYVSYLFLVLVLYLLLEHIDRRQATLMMILVLVSVPLSLISVKAKIDLLSLLKNEYVVGTFTADQIQAQMMGLLDSFYNGITVAQFFWGFWLFPFGYLVYKSGFLPKFLGVMLMIGCFYYVLDSVAAIAIPAFRGSIIENILSMCAMIGEFGICLWMLVIGDRPSILPKKKVKILHPG